MEAPEKLHRSTNIAFAEAPTLLPSQSFQEFLRLLGLKGKGDPEMSRFWIRWLSRFIIRTDTSPPSRRNSCRDMSASRCWSQKLEQILSSGGTPPQSTCKAPLHTLINPKLQRRGRALFVVMWQVRQNQDEPRSRSSVKRFLQQCPLHSRKGLCTADISNNNNKKKQQENKNAESLLAQIVEVRTGPVLVTHCKSDYWQLRVSRSSGKNERRKVEGAEGSRQSTNPLLLLMLIIFLHSSTNLPFLPLFPSPPAFRPRELGTGLWWKSMKTFVLEGDGSGNTAPLWSIGMKSVSTGLENTCVFCLWRERGN